MLKHLLFSNFKCFKKPARVKCGGITLLYGKNSSGKTSAVKGALLLNEALKNVDNFQHHKRIIHNPEIKVRASRHSSLSLGQVDEIATNSGKAIIVGAASYQSGFKKCVFPTNGFSLILKELEAQSKSYQSMNSLLLEQVTVQDSEEKDLFSIELKGHPHSPVMDDWTESYQSSFKAKEWKSIEDKILEYVGSIEGRKLSKKKYGFPYFKKMILKIWTDSDDWFYGSQEPFEQSFLESREHYEDNYGYCFDGSGEPMDEFPFFNKEEIKALESSRSFQTFIQKLIKLNDKRLLNMRILEYAYYSDSAKLGWIDANYENTTYGLPLYDLLLGEIKRLRSLSFTFIPLNFSRSRIYDLDEVYAKSNEESPEYNIAKFLNFIMDLPNLRKLNETLKKLEVGYRVLPPDFERMNGFAEIKVEDLDFGKEMNLYDIGFGTTHFIFTLAAITEACDSKSNSSRVLFLEEPEVHCHPDLQHKLAIFVIAAAKEGETQIVIDTHSEIFALAFSQAIRGSAKKEHHKKVLNEFIDYEGHQVPSVVFNHFNKGRKDAGTTVTSMRLDADGGFVDEEGNAVTWPDPKGFFGHRYDYD
jgi:AAA15 family ATPase/GTPase